MKLTRIKPWGRFRLEDGREVNIHRGSRVGRGTDVYFYLIHRGSRVGRGTDVYFYLNRMKRVLVSDLELSKATEIFSL